MQMEDMQNEIVSSPSKSVSAGMGRQAIDETERLGQIQALDAAISLLNSAGAALVSGSRPLWRIVFHARLYLEHQLLEILEHFGEVT
jgi:hypothetical protein